MVVQEVVPGAPAGGDQAGLHQEVLGPRPVEGQPGRAVQRAEPLRAHGHVAGGDLDHHEVREAIGELLDDGQGLDGGEVCGREDPEADGPGRHAERAGEVQLDAVGLLDGLTAR